MKIETMAVYDNKSKLKGSEQEKMEKEKLHGALEMAGAICNQLNQSLQVILGVHALMEMDPLLGDRLKEQMKMIRDQISKMANLTWKLNKITQYETIDKLDSEILDNHKFSESRSEDQL